MDEMAANTVLYDLSHQCDKSFHRLVERRSKIRSYAVVEVLHQQFSQWAAHMGALASQSVSLDTRLKSSEELRSLVKQYLQMARRNLDRIESLEIECSDDETSEKIIDQMSETTKVGVSSPLVESLQALELAVDGLRRLGITIQRSSPANLTQRIQAFVEKNDRRVIENEVYLRIKDLLVDQPRRNHSGKANNEFRGATLSLCRQLAVSVSFRCSEIRFRRSHEEEHGQKRESNPESLNVKGPAPGPSTDTHERTITPTSAKKRRLTPQHLTNVTELPSWMNLGQAPSIPQVGAMAELLPYRRSFVGTSVVSIRPKDTENPGPPAYEDLITELPCPYCCRLYPQTKYEDERWWDRHIDDDLKPYACISEECLQPPQLFATFEGWKHHMEKEHSSNWIQKVHTPITWDCKMEHDAISFSDEKLFEKHIQEEHPDYAEESELEALKEWCGIHQDRQPHMCPFCNCTPEELVPALFHSTQDAASTSNEGPHQESSKPQESSDAQGQLLNHIANHVKQIGLMSIHYLDSYDDGTCTTPISSGKSNDKSRSLPVKWVGGEEAPEEPDSMLSLDKKKASSPAPVAHTNSWSTGSYTIGWISASPIEFVAAKEMLDEIYTGSFTMFPEDRNMYVLGRVGVHNVVLARFPSVRGARITVEAASYMTKTFPNIRFGLMVGIGWGVPSDNNDIRLGDVVVSKPQGRSGGVMRLENKHNATCKQPPQPILTVLSNIESNGKPERLPYLLEKLRQRYPDKAKELSYIRSRDNLYKAGYTHPSTMSTCKNCDKGEIVRRLPRYSDDPVIHCGLVASSSGSNKEKLNREILSKDYGALCLETEGACLIDYFPCIVIRGIHDYADSHKNDYWQLYAATVAACFAEVFLKQIHPEVVEDMSPANMLCIDFVKDQQHSSILEWLSKSSYSATKGRQPPGPGQWLLDSQEFRDWFEQPGKTLLCSGIRESALVAACVADHLSYLCTDSKQTVVYLNRNFTTWDSSKSGHLAAILRQLSDRRGCVPTAVSKLFKDCKEGQHKGRKPTYSELDATLIVAAREYSRVFLVLNVQGKRSNIPHELVHYIRHHRQEAPISLMVVIRKPFSPDDDPLIWDFLLRGEDGKKHDDEPEEQRLNEGLEEQRSERLEEQSMIEGLEKQRMNEGLENSGRMRLR